MKRVYALYYDFDNIENPKIKISSEKHWTNQFDRVESNAVNGVAYWNSRYYLSTSRTALKKKALELIREQIELLESEIKTLENIVVK